MGGPVVRLAAASLFAPLRRGVRVRVDRRFNRSRYDGELELERFASGLRDEVDLDRVQRELRAVAMRTLQPASAGVWLVDSARRT